MKWWKFYIGIVNRLGIKSEPKAFELFKSSIPSVEWLASKLRSRGYYYNDLSTTYRGQIYTVRKLIDLDHQLHLRIYRDGMVTGHYELRTEHISEHLKGVELRQLTSVEIKEVEVTLFE